MLNRCLTYFIEAPKACEGVKERYQHTKEWRKTIYGREDGGEGTCPWNRQLIQET